MNKLLQNLLLCYSAALAVPTVSAQALDADLMGMIRQHKAQVDSGRAANGAGLDQLLSQGQAQSQSKDAVKEVVGSMGMAPQTPPNGNSAADQVKTAKTIVFISLGMPDEDLRYLLREGMGNKDVVFLLRGTFNNDMKDTLQRLMQVLAVPDLKQVPNVLILPQAFSNYKVTAVPVVFVQDKQKRNWYQVNGAPSLAMAVKEVHAGKANHTIGKLWPVAEEDIAERMRAAVNGYDWKGWQRNMSTDLRRKFEEGHLLPYALSDASYSVDMSITFPADVADKDGKVVVKAGTRVNPLEKANVPGGAIMVIDPVDARQVTMAKVWLKKWPAAIVMITRYFEQGVVELGTKAVMLDAISVARFQLHSVPALLTAENKMLLVRNYAPRVQGGIQ